LVLGIGAVGLIAPALETMRFGDPLATGLGVSTTPVRILVLLLGALLAAVATSVAGPIGFIAMVSGPVATKLLPGSPALTAGVVGAAVLSWADVAAQLTPVIAPVPTGVLTGMIGAPVLIFLMMSRRR
jgi:iron complex transport system permease protein